MVKTSVVCHSPSLHLSLLVAKRNLNGDLHEMLKNHLQKNNLWVDALGAAESRLFSLWNFTVVNLKFPIVRSTTSTMPDNLNWILIHSNGWHQYRFRGNNLQLFRLHCFGNAQSGESVWFGNIKTVVASLFRTGAHDVLSQKYIICEMERSCFHLTLGLTPRGHAVRITFIMWNEDFIEVPSSHLCRTPPHVLEARVMLLGVDAPGAWVHSVLFHQELSEFPVGT